MVVYIGSDHRGEELRPRIASYVYELGYEYKDLGMNEDFPLMAQAVAKKVRENRGIGILICGTGQGMAMAANKFSGIRAAVCNTVEDARLARQHHDANIIAVGADRIGYYPGVTKEIIRTFLETKFGHEERYRRRIGQMY